MSFIVIPTRLFNELKSNLVNKSFINYTFGTDDFETKIWIEGDKMMADDPRSGLREILPADVFNDASADIHPGSPFGCIFQVLVKVDGHSFSDVSAVLGPMKPIIQNLEKAITAKYGNDRAVWKVKMADMMDRMTRFCNNAIRSKSQ